MKKILISMLAVAALVSCSKEESIRVDQGEAIAFGNAFVDNSTRATDPSYSGTADFTSFKVWGTVAATESSTPVAIFAGDTVSGTVGANSVWTCTVKQYWLNGAKYNFAALANAGTVTLGTDLLPKTVTYTADQTDLVYAKSAQYTGKESGNDLVAFTFQHLLSKVNFTVNNGSQSATGYSFQVRDIVIAGASAGTCDVTTTPVTWTATANDGYTIANITVDNDTASADIGTALLVVPGNVTVSFNVDIIVGGQVLSTKSYTSAVTTLAPANSYNFVVTPTVGEEIKFTVANDPTWASNTDITIQ
jgi:hypothetical protein